MAKKSIDTKIWDDYPALNPYRKQSKVNPQLDEDPYRMLTRDLFNKIAEAGLSGSEYQVLLKVIDFTWGWNVQLASFSFSQLAKTTGLNRRIVIRIAQKLKEKRIINYEQYDSHIIDDLKERQEYKSHVGKLNQRDQVNTFFFNKYYDTWLVYFNSTALTSDPNVTSDISVTGDPNDTSTGDPNDTSTGDPNDTSTGDPNDTSLSILRKESTINKLLKESTLSSLSSENDSSPTSLSSLEKERETNYFSYLKSTFEIFINNYPSHRRKKSDAKNTWLSIFGAYSKKSPDYFNQLDFSLFNKIIVALEEYKKTEQWNRDKGRWIPSADKWLKNHMFNETTNIKSEKEKKLEAWLND